MISEACIFLPLREGSRFKESCNYFDAVYAPVISEHASQMRCRNTSGTHL